MLWVLLRNPDQRKLVAFLAGYDFERNTVVAHDPSLTVTFHDSDLSVLHDLNAHIARPIQLDPDVLNRRELLEQPIDFLVVEATYGFAFERLECLDELVGIRELST